MWEPARGSSTAGCMVMTKPGSTGICQAVNEALGLCEADKKPLPPATANREYSWRFVLRVEKELHREVAIRALRSGESLNSYCQKVLKKAVGLG